MPTTMTEDIQRVLVVDDDDELRKECGELLRDMEIEPFYPDAPLRGVEEVLDFWQGKVDAVICDYKLNIRTDFADFNGDQLVAKSNSRGLPGLLCTSYTDSETTVPRSWRRYIPVLLPAGVSDQEQIRRGIAQCRREYQGIFDPGREPWRTLVRVTDVADDEQPPYFHVEVPAWKLDKKVRVNRDDLPEGLRAKIQSGQRLHARVNIGAKHHAELYFTDWEDK